MKMAAIYARVSSEQQREERTIASQTAALCEFARSRDLEVPEEWVFEDAGYSGATLERPGLERVRDLAAEGQIQAVLAYAPDRLSRKYAYQVLLIEEFARHGVETLFVKAPQGASAEDQLLVQFQGRIAEYERAQILERSRRGKRHRARSGEVSVLSGAPYGYRYIRKTDEAPASYLVMDAEARVVQRVYEMYTVEGLSMGEITRRLNAEGIPTRKQSTRWERSVVWAMLRNPAYRGAAAFGKTRVADRIRVTRAQRRRGGIVSSNSIGHERPRKEWIEIPVPALVSEESFARAQELLHENKIRSRRRTITPSVVQGLVSCQKCGYAFSRTSTYTTARKLHYYYKCIGSDSWRKLGGPVCDNRMVRQNLLDQIVWAEVIRLLEDPTLIQQELDRRLTAARSSDPTRKREQSLQRELIRVGKGIERLLTAYQEELLSLEQLRERMPALRQREQTLRAELQAIADHATDRATFLRLAETLTTFLGRLRSAADTLDIIERQRIVRLVVKDILIGDDSIVIRHCIPVGLAPPPDSGPPTPGKSQGMPGSQSYLLRSGSIGYSLAGKRKKFDFIGRAIVVNVNYRAHVTGLQPVVRHVVSQDNAIVFVNHTCSSKMGAPRQCEKPLHFLPGR
jgi:site-specific DNA recombinase